MTSRSSRTSISSRDGISSIPSRTGRTSISSRISIPSMTSMTSRSSNSWEFCSKCELLEGIFGFLSGSV